MTPDLFIALVKRGWPTWVAGAVIGAVLGWSLTLLQHPKYQAEAVLAPSLTQGTPNGIGSLLGPLQGVAGLALGLGGEGGATQRAITVLRSRAFSEKFVSTHGLAEVLDRPGLIARLLGPVESTPEDKLYRTARMLRTNLQSIRVDPKTGFVTIAVRWRDPTSAAEWANLLAEAVNQEMRARAIADADRAVEYLQNELKSQLAVEVRSAINELIESQMRNKMLANTQPEFVYTVLEPALPPHVDDFVSPNRPLTAAACAVLGALAGLLLVMRKKI